MNTRSLSCWNVSFVVLLVLDDGSTLGGLIQTPSENHKNCKTEDPAL